jgi:transposase
VYHNFIGIDISKDEFHVAVFGNNTVTQFANSEKGFKDFAKANKEFLVNGLVVLEATGGYEAALLNYCQTKKIAAHRANTKVVKSFIRSLSKLGKSDAIDAQGLARYAKERHEDLQLYVKIADTEKELTELANRRSDLKRTLTQEKNRLQAPDNKFCKSSNELIIEALKKEIERLTKRQQELISENESLTAKIELLAKEVAGIGETTAIQLVSVFPELGKLNRRQVASLAGLAPHPNESGKKIGYRATRGGRDNIKPILYMAAMAAARSKNKLGEFYKKLIAKGKKRMVALVALMRKILIIANAKIKELECKNICSQV